MDKKVMKCDDIVKHKIDVNRIESSVLDLATKQYMGTMGRAHAIDVMVYDYLKEVDMKIWC